MRFKNTTPYNNKDFRIVYYNRQLAKNGGERL